MNAPAVGILLASDWPPPGPPLMGSAWGPPRGLSSPAWPAPDLGPTPLTSFDRSSTRELIITRRRRPSWPLETSKPREPLGGRKFESVFVVIINLIVLVVGRAVHCRRLRG